MPQIQNRPTTGQPTWPKIVLIIAGLGPALLFWLTDSGPYHWLSDIQDDVLGGHSFKLSMAIIAFSCMFAAIGILRLCGIKFGPAAKNRPPQR